MGLDYLVNQVNKMLWGPWTERNYCGCCRLINSRVHSNFRAGVVRQHFQHSSLGNFKASHIHLHDKLLPVRCYLEELHCPYGQLDWWNSFTLCARTGNHGDMFTFQCGQLLRDAELNPEHKLVAAANPFALEQSSADDNCHKDNTWNC